ncbi:MAG: glycosyltransferase family 39 protein [Candidatus Melainabacteria bacterium]|nr:glycosyltransferase family 39 protein [Candidatus Melainabacteria bacterium]
MSRQDIAQGQPTTIQQDSTVKGAKPGAQLDWLVALLCLLIIELICYGPIVRHIGFYLDDWKMCSFLQLGPQSLVELTKYCFWGDARVIIRPVEAPYFASLFLLFGANPFPYHLVNGALEVVNAWLLYLSLARLIGNRSLSLMAALILLLYPAHDATHYWMVASSVTVSLFFYLSSLWLTLTAVQTGKLKWHIFSALAFAASVYNYESFLPLCVLNAAAAFLLWFKIKTSFRALLNTMCLALPFLVVIASFWLYQRSFLPSIGKGWVHSLDLDPQHLIQTVFQGVRVTFSPYAFSFFIAQAQEAIAEKLALTRLILLVALTLVTVLALWWVADKHQTDKASKASAYTLLPLGFLSLFVSFTIFGFAGREYLPTLLSGVNRVNTGGCLGVALILPGIIALVFALTSKVYEKLPVHQYQLGVTLIVGAMLVNWFVLSNWGLSIPWKVSWKMQQRIVNLIASKTNDFLSGDTIILANCPRYVLWSPVFDGVWDFQAMVQLTLDNDKIQGDVVSERMTLSGEMLRDVSSGFTCGIYPFKRMFMLIPCPETWISIRSADHFINSVEQYGLGFGLKQETIARWKEELKKS